METNLEQISWLLILGLMIFVVDFVACVYMCVRGGGRGGGLHRCMQMYVEVRQESDVWYPSPSLLTLFTEVGSLTEPSAHRHG